MPSFNKVFLMGHLTRDPQLKFLQSQQAVAEFGLAVNRKWKSQDGQEREEVTFVDCTAWGRHAETINQYCQKGKALFVEGRLKLDTWDDKNGGGKRSKLSVVVENFQFVGAKDGGGEPSTASAPPKSMRQEIRDRRPPAQNPVGEEQHFKEEDVPF